MQNSHLTRKQQEVFNFLINNFQQFEHPPTLDELCTKMNLKSRGSFHKHIQALIAAGLVEGPNRKQRGIRLTTQALQMSDELDQDLQTLPYVGVIAAGLPIEAIEDVQYMSVPRQLKTEKPCYVLQIRGDSMVEAGIHDGDWVVIEKRSHAQDGEIVVALVNQLEATLKYIKQKPQETLLIPANEAMQPMRYPPHQVEVQGVLVGQMRSYVH